MPKEAFGGDDEGGPAPEKKKLSLGKFNLSPDLNIRDLFWSIMGSYAAAKKPGTDLKALDNDRFALMRVALSVLTTQNTEHYGLLPRFVAMYSLMMMLDGGWDDALSDFLQRAAGDKAIKEPLSHSLKRLMANDAYGEKLSALLASLVRSRDTSEAGLVLIASMGSRPIVQSLKKELVIIARGDIGANQLNAIKALSLIKEDEGVKRSLMMLLSHWDSQARMAAAEVLSSMGGDAEVKEAASKRLQTESDEEIKKILKRIAK